MASVKLYPPLRYALFEASPLPDSPSTEALHRGCYPRFHNLAFLSRLHLKTMLSLTPKSPAGYEKEQVEEREKEEKEAQADGPTPRKRRKQELGLVEWARQEDVKMVHIKVSKSKDGSIPFSTATVKQVLEMLISKENYPLYIHDLDGSDVLALVGAALRKLQGRTEKDWVAEMSRFLRAPPPEPEHLTFLRRLFAPSTNTSHHTSSPSEEAQQVIVIPPPSKRVSWLWPQGMPTAPSAGGASKKTTHHISMRVRVELDPGSNSDSDKEKKDGSSGGGTDREIGGVKTPNIGSGFSSRPTSRPTTSSGPPQSTVSTTIPDANLITSISGLGIAAGEEGLRRPTFFTRNSEGVATLRNITRDASPSPSRPSSSLSKTVDNISSDGKEKAATESSGEEMSVGEMEQTQDEGTTTGGEEEEVEDDDDEEDEEEEDLIPISQMIDALDLGL